MASPNCTVADGAGGAQATTNGVNCTPGNTVTIALTSTAGVSSWSLSCIGGDELTTPATVNAGLTVNSGPKTATFTAPAQGRALIFQSQVNSGLTNGVTDPTQTTTIGIYTLTSGGIRVIADNETVEGNASYGWIVPFNTLARGMPYTASLLADFTSTTSTSAQNTNLTVNVPATFVGLVEFGGNWSLASGTSGAKLAISIPTGATIRGSAYGVLATAAGFSSSAITAGATLTSAFNTATGPVESGYYGSVRVKGNGTNSGAIVFQAAPAAAVVLTVKAGSWMRLTPDVEL